MCNWHIFAVKSAGLGLGFLERQQIAFKLTLKGVSAKRPLDRGRDIIPALRRRELEATSESSGSVHRCYGHCLESARTL